MKLEGLHHITMITGDAQQNVEFYADVLGPAARQEDGQLRRARRLPPVLRRRGRLARHDPHLVRVRRARGRGRAGAGDDPHDPARRRLRRRRSTSGPSASRRTGYASERGDGALRFADYDGLALRARRRRRRQPAAARRAPRDPGGARDPRRRGRARVRRADPTADRALLTETLGLHRGRRRRVPPRRRRAPLPLGLRPGAGRARRCQGAGTVHHIAWALARRGPPGLAASASREAGMHVTPVQRPRLLPTSIYFREPQRHPVRDRDDSRPASPSTRTPSTSARRCACPTQHEHLRPQLERVLTPVVNPRAAQRARPRR